MERASAISLIVILLPSSQKGLTLRTSTNGDTLNLVKSLNAIGLIECIKQNYSQSHKPLIMAKN